MEIKWSKDQEAVIEGRDSDLLVAAAAGSGKTAVLVERIVRRVTDPVQPVDIDRLLVVTFTSAAAAEMKERIAAALDQRIEADPGNQRLVRQRLLVDYAQISTMHSFCMRLIRDYFDRLNIDPSFTLIDDAEKGLIQAELAGDVMEGWYASGDAAFRQLSAAYGGSRDDKNIEQMILKLYRYTESCPDPEGWLETCLRQYEQGPDELLDFMVRQAKDQAAAGLLALSNTRAAAEAWGDEGYMKALDLDRPLLEALLAAEDYDTVMQCLSDMKWHKLTGKRTMPKDVQKKIDGLRKGYKDPITALPKKIFNRSPESLAGELAWLRPYVRTLIGLVRDFSARYAAFKEEKNKRDFADLEHLALRLLVTYTTDEEGHRQKQYTDLADDLAAFYGEIICDEYQDSNEIQETLLDALSAKRLGRHDRFMVGDVKQSIYGFRQSDPSIFLGKYENSSPEPEAKARRIDLHQNFRSRYQVLESANFIFRKLMQGRPGGIVYDEAAALNYGEGYPEKQRPEYRTQVLLLDYDRELLEEDDDRDRQQLEAALIAGRIRELTHPERGLMLYDSKSGEKRLAGYDDIVILLRSVSGGWGETLVNVLGSHGIPASAVLSKGFFDTPEIRVITELLNIIDNPDQDIPLAAVMHSVIGGFSSEAMAVIRAAYPKPSLYQSCLAAAAAETADTALGGFMALLADLRKAAAYLDTAELLQLIMRRTGYDELMQALPAGDRRRRNLELLLSHAAAYGKGGDSSCSGFVHYIQQIRETQDVDLGEADVPSDGDGRVRIMTIHKSKGLEFPIVILAALGKHFNKQDQRAVLALHAKAGIGLGLVDPIKRRKMDSVRKQMIRDCINEDEAAEELRLLYVAMTRAKEKLIMTGSVTDIDKELPKWRSRAGKGPMAPVLILKAAGYLDLIMPCLMGAEVSLPIRERYHLDTTPDGDNSRAFFEMQVVPVTALVDRAVAETAEKKWTRQALEEKSAAVPAPLSDALQQDLNWVYAYQDILKLRGKYSVSELKKQDYVPASEEAIPDESLVVPVPEERSGTDGSEDRTGAGAKTADEKAGDAAGPGLPEEEDLPSFMRDEADTAELGTEKNGGGRPVLKLAPNERGTAYHRVMELLDFAALPEKGRVAWILGQMEEMTAAGLLTPSQKAAVYARDIAAVFEAPMGDRMRAAAAAGRLHKEAPFVMSLPVSRIRPEIAGDDRVVIQGIIDVWFEEEDGIVLLDYKTDRVRDPDGEQILWQHYAAQLDYYADALTRAQGKRVKERVIYSFALERFLTQAYNEKGVSKND